MTNKEAVNWITNLYTDIGKPEHSELWHYEQALYEIREILKSAQQWIPCSERLPVENTEVLTYDSSFGITFDSLLRGKWRKQPVAWMPLPEPYRPEEVE